jgi:hypothetical protein
MSKELPHMISAAAIVIELRLEKGGVDDAFMLESAGFNELQ